MEGEGTRGEKEKLREMRKLAEIIRSRAAYASDMAGAAGQFYGDVGGGFMRGEGIKNLQGAVSGNPMYEELQRGGQQSVEIDQERRRRLLGE